MKNQISKSVKFRAFFGLSLILMFSISILGQENTEEKKEKDNSNGKRGFTLLMVLNKVTNFNGETDVVKISEYQNLLFSGIKSYKDGDYNSALSDLNVVIEKCGYLKAFLYRGKIYEKKGDYVDALRDYSLLVQENQEFLSEAYLGIGNIYLYKRNYEQSLENYNQAIFFNLRLSSAYFGRATVYLELGKILNQKKSEEEKEKAIKYFKNALKDLDSVIELNATEVKAETYLRRSQVYRQLGDSEKADADFQKYNELDNAPKLQP